MFCCFQTYLYDMFSWILSLGFSFESFPIKIHVWPIGAASVIYYYLFGCLNSSTSIKICFSTQETEDRVQQLKINILIHKKLSMEQETKITWQRNIITSWTPPSCWVAMDNKIPSKASVLSAIMLWNVFHVLKFENLPAKNFPATSNGRRFDRKHELVTSVADTIISSTKEKLEDM